MKDLFSWRRLIRSGLFLFCFLGPSAFASIVSGTVYDEPSHLPLSQAHVLFGWDKGLQRDSLITDSTGTFRFSIPSGCGYGCYAVVRKEGYWMNETFTFLLDSAENREIDLGMELIHAFVIRVVSARDSSLPLDSARAMLVPDSGRGALYRSADPSGRMRFPSLYALPVYRLTVAVPGYKTYTHAFRFDGPKPEDTVGIALEPDTTRSSKSVQGTLTANGEHPYQGYIALRCRSALVQADLFSMSGPDGRFTIRGIPPECDTGSLYTQYSQDSLALSLKSRDTSVTWDIKLPRPLDLRPGPAGVTTPQRRGNVFDLLGRRVPAIRPRRLP